MAMYGTCFGYGKPDLPLNALGVPVGIDDVGSERCFIGILKIHFLGTWRSRHGMAEICKTVRANGIRLAVTSAAKVKITLTEVEVARVCKFDFVAFRWDRSRFWHIFLVTAFDARNILVPLALHGA